ncbi:MAG: FAD-dependent monooxygenase [Pontibacterium sp.]
MINRYDVVVVGGGMVGAALACALGNTPLSVAVIEGQYPCAFSPEQDYDLRVSALSVASQRILENVGAWEGVRSRRSCEFSRMKVWEQSETHASTEFDASNMATPYLGHIVENRIIQLALLERAQQFENITLFCPAKTTQVDYAPGASVVSLADGREIVGKLLVAADGARSKVREAAKIGTHGWDYEQQALVATVTTAYKQQDITWQQFTPNGPRAFLPLPANNGSLVWYDQPEKIAQLKKLNKDDLKQAFYANFPDKLGEIGEIVAAASFPLRRQHAQHYVKEGVALIGDSAHTINPLAGQGVNIGLLDAAELGNVILNAVANDQDFTQLSVLSAYEKARRPHNLIVMQSMDAFYKVFSNQSMPLRLIRNFGLGLAGKLPFAKDRVARIAMGLEGRLPPLAH